MRTLIRFFQLTFIPTSSHIALLVLRLWLGGSLLILHGWRKLLDFSSLSGSFPDPLGVGSQWSLVLAICGEVLCPILLVFGLFTRLAALGSATAMGVAWYMAHGAALTGENSGELAFIYLAGFVALVFGGAGRFSFDGSTGGSTTHIKPQSPKK